MSKTIFTTTFCLLLSSVSLGQAQTSHQHAHYFRSPVAATFGVKRYDHASTYRQSVLDGMANFIGARGQAQYYHSLARFNNERTREARLKNEMAKVKNYFAKKELRRYYFAKKRKEDRLRSEARRASRMAKLGIVTDAFEIA